MKRAIACCLCAMVTIGATSRAAVAQTESERPIATAAAAATAPPTGAEEPTEGGVAIRLLRDIGRDYKNYFSVENAVVLGVGGGAAGLVHLGDESIAEWAQGENLTLEGGSTYGSQWLHIPVALAWWVIGSAAGSERNAATGRDLLRAQISVVSWTYAIKLAANRTRPNGDPHSFPSGHASTSFATAMVLQEHFGWKLGVPAFAAATYTVVSRVTENQHWASDVVFGAAVGLASGRTVTLRLRNTGVAVAPL